jgi:ABC-type antimicrobial peptide transport system permease subunit
LILFATLTGAISGVIPAVRASKINPVDALRYE